MFCMLVILKCFSRPTILLALWTFVGEEVREMFCFNMYGDTGFSTVCECKAQSTRKTSVFINCRELFEVLRTSNILKQTQLRKCKESYTLNISKFQGFQKLQKVRQNDVFRDKEKCHSSKPKIKPLPSISFQAKKNGPI